jgi:hypothetical protein
VQVRSGSGIENAPALSIFKVVKPLSTGGLR